MNITIILVVVFMVLLFALLIYIVYVNLSSVKYPKLVEKPFNPEDKIIHQTWKTHDLSEKQVKLTNTWKKNFPDWKYKLYDDNDIDVYVKEKFPELYDMWNSLSPFIKKVDSIRYMWMYDMGGIYSDIDIECYSNFENIIKNSSAYLMVTNFNLNWRHNTDRASPSLTISNKGNPVWLFMLRYICKVGYKDVHISTGPSSLSNCITYINKLDLNYDITYLKENKFGIGFDFGVFNKYTKHYNHTVWKRGQQDKESLNTDRAIKWLDEEIKNKCGQETLDKFLTLIKDD